MAAPEARGDLGADDSNLISSAPGHPDDPDIPFDSVRDWHLRAILLM
jgi:hypothetical protein